MASRAMASHNGPPAKASEASPSPTLFLKNLPEKMQKQDLRMALYMLFSTYGPVLDIVAMKNGKMRGMAHVVFRDVQSSTQAMRALQNFDFFGKDLKIQYGKGRSNVFTRLEGSYKPSNAPETTSTEVQQSIFTAPAVTGTLPNPPATGIPSLPAAAPAKGDDEGPQGMKRRRDDESDEEEAPMEEDDDDDVSMEASSDDE